VIVSVQKVKVKFFNNTGACKYLLTFVYCFIGNKKNIMALSLIYEFLFIGRDDNSFLENYYYDLFQDYGTKSGQIFISLEIQNNPVDAEEIADVIFETMKKEFFEHIDMDPYARFEITLKSINAVLSEYKSKKNSGYIGNLNMIVAAVVDNTLYLSQCGDSEAYLIRKRFVSVVSEGLDEGSDSDDVFTNIANGEIEESDFILFSSTRLLRYISKNDLAGALKMNNVVDSLSEIKDVISTEMLGKLGLTGVFFNKSVESDKEPVFSETPNVKEHKKDSSMARVSSKKKLITGKFLTSLKKYKNRMRASTGGLNNFLDGLLPKGVDKKKILTGLVVVICVLVIGIFLANGNGEKEAKIAEYDEVLDSVQLMLTEAETKSAYAKDEAKIILDKAYNDVLTVYSSGYHKDKSKIFLDKIEDLRDGLDNVKRITSPKVFADLKTKRPDVNAMGFVEVGDRVFVYEYNALYELVLDQIQDPITIDENESIVAATGFEDRGSVVFITKSGKVIEYREGAISFMDTEDGTFNKGVAVDDWSNKIYIMDPVSNQIWKYTYKSTRDTFSSAEKYLVSDDVDISGAKDFAIDANVYVLNSNSDIYKFYGGKEAKYSIEDLPLNKIQDPKSIYTDDRLDRVYVLDSKGKRIFVYYKEGGSGNLIYNLQYFFDGEYELRDFYVEPDTQKLYVLTKDVVLEIDL